MTTTVETTTRQHDSTSLPPFATAGVSVIAAVSALALLLTMGNYGYFGDELYFLAGGRRLAFGYADQGPALPLIAHVMDLLAPDSYFALRIPATIATIACVVVSALIARELDGGRGAQLLTAGAYATSPFLLVQGTSFATNTFDTALWVLITWLLIRWVRTRSDVLLIWAGVATAADMQVKWLIPFLWICLGISVLAFGPRDLLRRPQLWIGAAIAVVVTIPSLLWQADHDWPQLAMAGVVSGEQQYTGGRGVFVPLAIALAGLLGAILLIYGTWRLFRAEALRPYRFLGLTLILLVLAFIVTGGRAYYAAGMYAAIMAAGAVELTRRDAKSWAKWLLAPVAAISVAIVVWSLPWQPESKIPPTADTAEEAGADLVLYGHFGWPELVSGVADAYRQLTPAEQTKAVIVTDSYWKAAAVDQLGGKYDLPRVYSPIRGFGYFGTPPDSATTVVYVGDNPGDICRTVQKLGRVDARLGFPGATKGVDIWKCSNLTEPWSQAWPGMLKMS
ncbi:glycosyltransferase family 39 protein [Antrihabitans cavernicola]|uniref:Glycosyltransferase family 39 protein n=1 Tax=Antrihabitans cavernicola TaxID=2495913 RepID=A0A5A7SAU7_9NOCA|nr:glycosyltransferase family 39 protein [Spelaeibacter cavernicola]KAA0021693.1 glycosyltransferase family 39 protein [Spelaeibacter cavernicola]